VAADVPDRPKDRDAIAVHAEGGGKLGYLSRENAEGYGQMFKPFEKRGYNAVAARRC
jgi:hypothetical protein